MNNSMLLRRRADARPRPRFHLGLASLMALMALMALTALAACSSDSNQTTTDLGTPDTTDTSNPDLTSPDTTPDSTPDTTPDTTREEVWVPTPGSLGWPCEGTIDCNDGWCLTSSEGQLCSQSCSTTCPAGWACRQNTAVLPDVAFTCMPPAPNLCRPCQSNADCLVDYDSAAHACIPRGDDGAFCGALCESDTDCPDESFCAPVVDIAGNNTRQCVPVSGTCSCSARAIAENASTTCRSANPFGRCPGLRSCAAEGLTDCDAVAPALDECNGLDDNCDGQTDEAFVAAPCTVDNDFGSCPGTTRCDTTDGVVCEGTPPVAESCNGLDDNCDGQTDEEDATGCTPYFEDADGDTFGNALASSRCLCAPSAPFTATRDTDCDDTNRRKNPLAAETCNGQDDDCNGQTDEGSASGCTTFYADTDDDSFGDAASSNCLCLPTFPFDTRDATDCDDALATINPAVSETCNGKDDDCDGQTDEEGSSGCLLLFRDLDLDTHGDPSAFRCLCAPTVDYSATTGGDCDDTNNAANPTRTEVCTAPASTPLDEDCDGLIDEANAIGCTVFHRDEDGDTFGLTTDTQCLCAPTFPYTATRGGDCNDRSALAFPNSPESCDGVDNDCDVTVDEPNATGCTTFYQDRDLDGRGVLGQSACLCQSTFPFTADTTDDCDDTNPFISPIAAERCNGLDDDCNGLTDEGVTGQCSPFYKDGDADGWGDGDDSLCLCSPDGEYTATRTGDCDDTRIDVYPFADELCDGENAVDDDCDGETDEEDSLGCVVYFRDGDGDGFGLADDSRCLCAPAAPYAAIVAGDCDDTRNTSRPGATESCNSRDDDCDGQTDEVNATGCSTWLRDSDGDSFGLALDSQCLCAPNNTYRANLGGDCDDSRLDVNPGFTELCDGRDNDCNGVADDPGATFCSPYFTDVDGDTWGVGTSQCLCAPTGLVTATRTGDCNDLAASAFPGSTERCNQVDDDCDGQTDEGNAVGCTTFLRDVDGDGFGIAGNTQCLCAPGPIYRALLSGDCDDGNVNRSPGEPEVCNNFDDDCDLSADPDGSSGCLLRYADSDRDGFGVSETLRCLCNAAAPWDAAAGGDCDDDALATSPNATEVCNGRDDDCDGLADEVGATGCTTYYLDADGDRVGVAGQSLCLCGPQAAYSATVAGDCDDGDARRTPGKTEVCNNIDDDCDGQTDEDGAAGCQVYWRDVDDDTYGVASSERCVCAPTGDHTATRTGDCDDNRSDVNISKIEVCDSIDNDCDDFVDESTCGLPTVNWPTAMRDARRTGHPFFTEGPTATDTALRWKKVLAANTPIESSPVIDEDGFIHVIAGATLFKLNPSDGATVWSYTLPATPFSRAGPTVRVGGTLLVPAGNRVLLLTKSGALIWTASFGGEPNNRVVGSPIVDQNGEIYVASNTHLRALSPSGTVLWATAIVGDTNKSSEPAIGPDGRVYLSGSQRVYSFSKAGAINWTWCPLVSGNCDGTKTPGASVTVNEVGRVLAPMGNTLYLLADAQTQATLVSSATFTNSGGVAAKLWSTVPVFSTGYTCCNPEEYALVTPAGPNGARMLTASLGTDFSMTINKKDAAHGAAIFDRDGDIFVGSNATSPTGKARFSARRNRGAGASKGTEYWGFDVDGANIDGAPALGTIGNLRYVVFGDSSGTLYNYGK